MADGGDGFGEIVGALLDSCPQTAATVDSAGRPRQANWWLSRDRSTAVVEAARVNGLALVESDRYHPFQLDTFGLGALLKAVEDAKPRTLYIGVGGSATNDGGFGLARAIGWRFLDRAGVEILSWVDLERLASVASPATLPVFNDLVVAVDVKSPLLGPNGASRLFGPQKGLRGSDIPRAEACLARLAEVLEQQAGLSCADEAGTGAAGGLGFGLRAFCGARIESGGEIFASLSKLEERIARSDLVITAEGLLDAQTLQGKGVSVVASVCGRAGKDCWCLAGAVSMDPSLLPWANFRSFAIAPGLASTDAAKKHAARYLCLLATQVAQAFCWPTTAARNAHP